MIHRCLSVLVLKCCAVTDTQNLLVHFQTWISEKLVGKNKTCKLNLCAFTKLVSFTCLTALKLAYKKARSVQLKSFLERDSTIPENTCAPWRHKPSFSLRFADSLRIPGSSNFSRKLKRILCLFTLHSAVKSSSTTCWWIGRIEKATTTPKIELKKEVFSLCFKNHSSIMRRQGETPWNKRIFTEFLRNAK